jgi:hypothetical protein
MELTPTWPDIVLMACVIGLFVTCCAQGIIIARTRNALFRLDEILVHMMEDTDYQPIPRDSNGQYVRMAE